VEDWLEAHELAVSVGLTAALVIVTAVYAVLTWLIAKANKDLVSATRDMAGATEQMAQLTADTLLAQVAAFLTASRGGATLHVGQGGDYHTTLRNSGKGTALDLEAECDLIFPDGHRVQLGTQTKPYVAADETVTMRYQVDADVSERMGTRNEQPTQVVRLRYRDTFRNWYESVQEGDQVPEVRKVS